MGLHDLCDQCQRLCRAKLVPIDFSSMSNSTFLCNTESIKHYCFQDRDSAAAVSQHLREEMVDARDICLTDPGRTESPPIPTRCSFLTKHNRHHFFQASASGCHLCTLFLYLVREDHDGHVSNIEAEDPHMVGMPVIRFQAQHGDCDTKDIFRSLDSGPQWHERDQHRPIRYQLYMVFSSSFEASSWAPPQVNIITSALNSGLRSGDSTLSGFREDTIKWIQAWIANCCSEHPECTQTFSLEKSAPDLPTRLLKVVVQSGGSASVMLVDTSSLSSSECRLQYATLSHCWGSNGIDVKLTRSNIGAYRDGVTVASLPHTFRQTLELCYQIGVTYVWIDALCIIQDDADDWSQEAAKMFNVYAGGTVNIAATSALNCHAGLLIQDDYLTPCNLRTLWTADGLPIEITVGDELARLLRCLDLMPLNRRGWVFQERLLSIRTIHFLKDQIWLQCQNGLFAECFRDFQFPDLKQLYQKFVDGHWQALVEGYSSTDLSYQSDRLAAIAGIAEAYIIKHGLNTEDYVAGMMKPDLVHQLFWLANGENGRSGVAPTWSWASVERGGVTFLPTSTEDVAGELQQRLVALDVTLTSNPETSFNSQRHGPLRLRGVLCQASFQRPPPKSLTGDSNGIERELHLGCETYEDYGPIFSQRRTVPGERLMIIRGDNRHIMDGVDDIHLLPLLHHWPLSTGLGKVNCPDDPDVYYCMMLRGFKGLRGTFERIGVLVLLSHSHPTPHWWSCGEKLEADDYLESHEGGVYDFVIV